MMGFSLETTLAPSDEQGKAMFDQDLVLHKTWHIDEGTFSIQIFIVVSVHKGIQIESFPFSIMLIHHQFVFVLKLLNVLKQRWRKISYFRIFSATLAQPVGWRRCWKSAIFRVRNLRAPDREPNNWEPIKRFAIRKYDEQDEDDTAGRRNAILKLNEMWNIV